ncbi:hypothetical protein SAMN05660991_01545 [Trujillonella endophytica]|uniref:Uncharacterized protein n=1 Tax=Trujillonella endophytica TaxID=673521 RepID=A0A1H8SA08_9ACTN|nr:hypothetical protein [Trujillella endophytica]SEO75501.1 hypothetical protein SAMN05660991_01545 [Trujillella endophytica]
MTAVFDGTSGDPPNQLVRMVRVSLMWSNDERGAVLVNQLAQSLAKQLLGSLKVVAARQP